MTNREPLSVACEEGRHEDCAETLEACSCTYRGLHKTTHCYASLGIEGPMANRERAQKDVVAWHLQHPVRPYLEYAHIQRELVLDLADALSHEYILRKYPEKVEALLERVEGKP